MPDRKHPIWFILFMAVVLGAGLIYCEMAYKNGSDLPKDTALISGIGSVVALWFKLMGGSGSDSPGT